jgi:hypothetical protein
MESTSLIDKFFNGKLDPFKATLPKILVPLIILRSKEYQIPHFVFKFINYFFVINLVC